MIDFHLPKMDGLEVVVAYRLLNEGRTKFPRFIGITADIEGLLSHPRNCENFDKIFSKPFDAKDVCKTVESRVTPVFLEDDEKDIPQAMSLIAKWPDTSRDMFGYAITPSDSGHKSDEAAEMRPSKRGFVSLDGTTMRMADGTTYKCRITNVTMGGAAVEVDVKPLIGEGIQIGRSFARVTRYTDKGIAVEFANIWKPDH